MRHALTKNGNGKGLVRQKAKLPPLSFLEADLQSLTGLRLDRVRTRKESAYWNGLIDEYNYLGYKPLPGAEVRYLIRWDGGDVGAIGFSAVAWRVLFVTMLGRECPDLPCTVLFEDDEWKSVYVIAKKEAPPETQPSLGDFTIMVASLGGYLNRKCDGPPGHKPCGLAYSEWWTLHWPGNPLDQCNRE